MTMFELLRRFCTRSVVRPKKIHPGNVDFGLTDLVKKRSDALASWRLAREQQNQARKHYLEASEIAARAASDLIELFKPFEQSESSRVVTVDGNLLRLSREQLCTVVELPKTLEPEKPNQPRPGKTEAAELPKINS